MFGPLTAPRSPRRLFFAFATLLAMAAQLVLAVAPLTEGRDRWMAPHVESGGAQTHHHHDEARCAACQARAIHGTAPRGAPVALPRTTRRVRLVARVERAASLDLRLAQNPRAPPVM